jgi:transposase InsO family protein
MKQKKTKQRGLYRMADDRWMVPMIRELVDQRPTYGYRRIQVLLNRKLRAQGSPGVNHKRVYRIMKHNNMLLSRYTGNRPMRAHNGMVITLRSNMRWCSDVFEIACSNAQIVRVAFSLDCCDREMISFVATTGGISSAMICDDFASQLGLVCCTTPVSSPESNGMAEAFIKTFKRDYVYINQRPDAQTVMTQLPHWFDDYNDIPTRD